MNKIEYEEKNSMFNIFENQLRVIYEYYITEREPLKITKFEVDGEEYYIINYIEEYVSYKDNIPNVRQINLVEFSFLKDYQILLKDFSGWEESHEHFHLGDETTDKIYCYIKKEKLEKELSIKEHSNLDKKFKI